MWTIDSALTFIREIEPLLIKNGWYVGLTGSVLIKGESKHDLDLIFYPMNNGKVDRLVLYGTLDHSFGMTRKHDVSIVHRKWWKGETYSADSKHVEVWETKDGRRVDLFIMS